MNKIEYLHIVLRPGISVYKQPIIFVHASCAVFYKRWKFPYTKIVQQSTI